MPGERLAVVVDTEQRHVEAVAREREVVGIAAVERGVELGREHEADVGELLVEIEVILRALIERHHFGCKPVFFCASFSIAAIAARRAASVSADAMPGLTAALTLAVTSSMDLQRQQLEIGRLHFLRTVAREKPS